MAKTRLIDIATKAGVGTATVERVLNARGNVRPETAERVITAARQLGYNRQLPQPYRGLIRIEVILVQPESGFFQRLNMAFARIAATLDSSIVVQRTFVDEHDPKGLAEHLADRTVRRSGLIIVAPDHPDVRTQLKNDKAAGIPIAHIVSRIGEEAGPFIGIDNYAAGRSAAFYLLHMLRPRSGRILALCHSSAYQVHKERIEGFSDYIEDHPDPALHFDLVQFTLDDRDRAADVLDAALRAYPDIIGLYNAGGANSGIAPVLQRRGLDDTVVWIGHELTERSRGWLKSGLMDIVLDQAPETQARRAIDTILKDLGFLSVEVSKEPVRFLTINAENL